MAINSLFFIQTFSSARNDPSQNSLFTSPNTLYSLARTQRTQMKWVRNVCKSKLVVSSSHEQFNLTAAECVTHKRHNRKQTHRSSGLKKLTAAVCVEPTYIYYET